MMDQSADRPQFSYDRVAYPAVLLPDQSPDRLHVSALLHGRESPDPRTASVFEIGCGNGLNLLAHAAATPEARIVGFDLSRTAIDLGRGTAAAAGLGNVDLHAGDILTYPREGERFDYVICHGVFSWVPEPVRAALLALIEARLAPGGVAYLSFECLPGAAAKAAIVRLLRRGVPEGASKEEAAEAAARTIATLVRYQHESSPLKLQLDFLARTQPWRNVGYFYHDWLAEHYAPIALPDFIAAAAAHNLSLAGSASNGDIGPFDIDQEALEVISAFGDDAAGRLLGLEMLFGPSNFYRMLLVRSDAPPPTVADGFRRLTYGFEGWRRPVDTEDGPAIRYGTTEESSITTNHPDTVAVFDCLMAARPAELGYDAILSRTGIAPESLDAVLREISSSYLLLVHASPQPFVTVPGERPRVTGLSRAMLASDNRAISLRGMAVSADQPETSVCLQLCDGTRTRAEIAAEMGRRFGREFPAVMIDVAIAGFATQRVFEA